MRISRIHICFIATLAALGAVAGWAGDAGVDATGRPRGGGAAPRPGAAAPSVPGEILIKLKDGVLETIERKTGKSGEKIAGALPESVKKINGALGGVTLEAVFREMPETVGGSVRKARAPKGAKIPRLEGIFKIKLGMANRMRIEDAIREYQLDPNIEYAEPNFLISVSATPNDPLYAKQWALNNTGQSYPSSGSWGNPPGTSDADIDAPEAWATTTGGAGVVIAVVDTGCDLQHRDLKNNIWTNAAELSGKAGTDDDRNGYIDDARGWDFANNDSDPTDDNGHGTHVAGIIAALGNNGLDVCGVCWQAKVMALKFANANGEGSDENAAKAIAYAAAKGADVISCSWGSYAYSQTLLNAVQAAISQGVLIVAAAGNESVNGVSCPAGCPGVIAVGATDSRDARAAFSNYGCWVDLAAPGVDILSLRASGTSLGTVQDAYTTVASGTSMACPFASAVAGLVLSRRPTLTAEQMRSLLKLTADPVKNPAHYLGQGRLNAQKAITETGTPPLCRLNMAGLLAQNGMIGGKIDITGTASGGDFTSYTLYYGAGEEPTAWTRLATSTTAVTSGVLYGQFNTSALADGLGTIRLDVGEKKGRKVSDRRYIRVQNVTATSPYSNDILRPGGVVEVRLSGNETYTADSIAWGIGAQPASWSSQGMTLVSGAGSLMGKWDTSFIRSNNFYTLRIRCHSASGSREVYIRSVYFDTRLKAGWPQYVPCAPGQRTASYGEMVVTVDDLDGDGKKELVCVESADMKKGTPAALRVYRSDGTLAWRRELDYYPVTEFDHPANSAPVVGDLDGDGQKEIFVDVGSKTIATGIYSFPLYGFRADGSRMAGSWPVLLPSGFGPKTIADVNGDGRLELVYGNCGFTIYTIDYTGKILNKIPINVSLMAGGGPVPRQMATGRFDDSGKLGLVGLIGGFTDNNINYYYENVTILHPDGTTLPGWPLILNASLIMDPIAADVNGDGYDELLFCAAVDAKTGQGGGVYLVDRFGHSLPGWPIMAGLTWNQVMFMHLSMGDLNGDGKPEVIVTLIPQTSNSVYTTAYDLKGQPLPTWVWGRNPGSCVPYGQPVIGDIDGDGRADVISLGGTLDLSAVNYGDFRTAGGIWAWRGDGERIRLCPEKASCYPIWTEGVDNQGRVELADLDGDGKLDLIATSNYDMTVDGQNLDKQRDTIYVYELDVPYRPNTMHWPAWQHDPQRTGRYQSLPPTGVRKNWGLYE